MKHILYSISALLFTVSCASENTTSEPKEKKAAVVETSLEEPSSKRANKPTATFVSETLDLKHCESAVYDKRNDVIYASLIGGRKDGDGAIATVGLDGKLANAKFVSELNDPKGIAINGDRLYVSDVTELVEVDLATGKVIKKHTVKGIQFLNDVAIDDEGNVYVSDTHTSEIYILDKEGVFKLWMADPTLDNPNGLLIQGKSMYVASWGSKPEGGRVSKIDMKTMAIEQVSSMIGNLDGIRPYDNEHLIISDWNSGNIHLMDFNGKTEQVLQVGQSVGDIAYIKEKNLLLLPMNKQSRLLFYKLD